MYFYSYIYTYLFMYLYMYLYVYFGLCIYTYGIYICVCVYLYIHMYMYVYIYTHIHLHTYTHVHTEDDVPPSAFHVPQKPFCFTKAPWVTTLNHQALQALSPHTAVEVSSNSYTSLYNYAIPYPQNFLLRHPD